MCGLDDRPARWHRAGLPLVVTGILVAVFAGTARAGPLEPTTGDGLQVLITTSELAVGQNRFGFGLLKDGTLLADAEVLVRIYDLRAPEPRLSGETSAPYHRLEIVENGNPVHIHPDGTRHVHGASTDVQGLYVARLTFPRSGPWGLEVLARRPNGPVDAARLRVDVLAVSQVPAAGTPAPRSRNVVAGDVSDLRSIDSSDPPDPRLHATRIADAIASGRPQVIVFASPRHCTSRVCGPMVDVVRTLIPAYGERVAFVHQEIWQAGSQRFTPTVEEWKLRSEPWIFVVDGSGTIRARFEGLTTRREIEAVLRNVLGAE